MRRAGTTFVWLLALLLGVAGTARAQLPFVDFEAFHEGSSDSLAVVFDELEPFVEITSPTPGFASIVGGTTITVTGTVEDWRSYDLADGASPVFGEVLFRVADQNYVTTYDGNAPLVDGRFVISDVLLTLGLNRIYVYAIDTGHNVGQRNIRVMQDPNVPPVTLTNVHDGEAFLVDSVPIDLNFGAPTTIVAVNYVPDGRDFGAGFFEDVLVVDLVPGPNTIRLDLESGGEPFTFSFTLFRVESVGPIEITSPADLTRTNQTTATVTGTVPLGTPFVEVNGVVATIAPDLISFMADVDLEEGANTIEALARPFGQRDSVRVTLDTVPPVLERIFPNDGAFTSDTSIDVGGFVSEQSLVEVSGPADYVSQPTEARLLFGGNAPLGIDPLFAFLFEFDDFELALGPNAIDVTLTDLAGNQTVETLTFTQSDSALLLDSPPDGTSVPTLATDVTFQALEPVTLDGVFSAGRRFPGFDGVGIGTGLFTLLGVPLVPGPTDLRVVYTRDASGAQEVLNFSLTSTATDAATVTGTVTDAQTGEPLGGALVSVLVNGRLFVVPTAADGTYSLQVEPGDVVVTVEHEGFVQTSVGGMPAAGDTFVADASLISWSAIDEDAPSDPSGLSTSVVTGTVTDATNGQPLDGALIQIEQGGVLGDFAITGPSGTFTIGDIPPGDFQVNVVRAGFFAVIFDVAAPDPMLVTVAPALQPLAETYVLLGNVVSGLTGQPEPDVEIQLLTSDLEVVTDSAGVFTIPETPIGVETLRFQKEGFLDYFFIVDSSGNPDGSPVEFDFTYPVERGTGGSIAIDTTVQGVVQDSLTKRPIEGAAIEAGSATATSDVDGVFVISGLPTGALEIRASAPDFADQTLQVVVVANGDDPLAFDLDALTLGFIEGTITDAQSGQPVRYASVDIEESPLLSGGTISDGTYRIARVPPGTYPIVVKHPGYFSKDVAAVEVLPGQTASLDATLDPLPSTGGLTGIITDASTGDPVDGAIVTSLDTVATSTTGSDGRYTLSGLPAGLVSLRTEAAGFATTTRTTGVVADLDDATPTVTEVDFAIDVAGTVLRSVTAVVDAASGGSLATPDGRFQFEILPNSLTANARVTLTPPDVESTASGDLLSIDPDLAAPDIRAVGGEIALRVEALVEGDPIPNLVGPVIMVMRYSAADAASQSVVEDSLAPYYFDGSSWTLLRTVPHLHAVDQINKVAVSGMIFAGTEAGGSVISSLRTRHPVLLAQVGPPPDPLDLVREWLLRLGGAIRDDLNPAIANVEVVSIATDAGTPQDFNDQLVGNGYPLVIFSGWDWKSLFFNVEPDTNPFADRRYQRIIRDMFGPIHGVYEPFYVSNNSRARLKDTGNAVSGKIDDILNARKALFFDEPEKVGVNGFGYSQGTIVARAYQAAVRTQSDFGGTTGPIRVMVLMGAPNHGAIQGLEFLMDLFNLSIGEFELPVTVGDVIRSWSPGTAQLLDYDDATGSGNRYLFDLNRNDKSLGDLRTVLVGGTDRRLIIPNETEGLDDTIARLVGDVVTGVINGRHDGAVPLFSALGQIKLGSALPTSDVPSRSIPLYGFRSARRFREFFSHNQAGMAVQPITEYARRAITDNLYGWTSFDFVPPPEQPPLVCPNVDDPGRISAKALARWNTPEYEFTGAALVIYKKDGEGNWSIVAGADDSGSLRNPGPNVPNVVWFEDTNSKALPDLEMSLSNIALPKLDLDDPKTRIKDILPIAVAIGGHSKWTDGVPTDPNDFAFFEAPGIQCPCPDETRPACQ